MSSDSDNQKSSHKDAFVRSTLKRSLSYRHHIQIYLPIILMVGLIFNGIMLTLLNFSENEAGLIFGSSLTHIFFWVFGNGYLGVVLYVSKNLGKTVIDVSPEEILIKNGAKSIPISYSEIKSIEVSGGSKLGGWFFIHLNDGKKHRITSALERSDYILDSIITQRPDLENKEEILRFRRQAVSQDHSTARFFEMLSQWKVLLFKLVFLPISFSIINIVIYKNVESMSSLSTVLIYHFAFWFFISLFLISFLYQTTEFFLSKKIESASFSSSKDFARDSVTETLMKKRMNAGYYSLLALLFILTLTGVIGIYRA